MKHLASPHIAWSLAWAAAIVASAFLFKGSADAAWIEAALTGLALVFVVLKSPRPDCLR